MEQVIDGSGVLNHTLLCKESVNEFKKFINVTADEDLDDSLASIISYVTT